MTIKISSKGMTLLEVLIAMTILAFVLVALTGLLEIFGTQNTYNRDYSIATFLSQAKLQEFQNLAFDDTTFTSTTDWTPRPDPELLTATGQVSATGMYQRQWNIYHDPPSNDLKKVMQVRTRWIDYKGKQHELVFQSTKTSY